MADQKKHTLIERLSGWLDMGSVPRIAAWGLAAAVAVALAVLASRSEIGSRRVAMAANPAQTDGGRLVTARAEEAEREVRRLAETVQNLSADRDKLLNRVASLERSLEDLTGSIALTQPARRPPIADELLAPGTGLRAPAQPPDPVQPAGASPDQASLGQAPPTADAPMSLAPDPTAQPGSARMSEGIPIPRADPRRSSEVASQPAVPHLLSPSASIAGEPEAPSTSTLPAQEAVAPAASATSIGHQSDGHGIELGSATSIEGLRALWKKVRQGEAAPLLAGLKPVVSVRDAAQPGSVELRLVAGPVPSALAASRLCAALSAAGAPCRATTFDGQSLAAR